MKVRWVNMQQSWRQHIVFWGKKMTHNPVLLAYVVSGCFAVILDIIWCNKFCQQPDVTTQHSSTEPQRRWLFQVCFVLKHNLFLGSSLWNSARQEQTPIAGRCRYFCCADKKMFLPDTLCKACGTVICASLNELTCCSSSTGYYL